MFTWTGNLLFVISLRGQNHGFYDIFKKIRRNAWDDCTHMPMICAFFARYLNGIWATDHLINNVLMVIHVFLSSMRFSWIFWIFFFISVFFFLILLVERMRYVTAASEHVARFNYSWMFFCSANWILIDKNGNYDLQKFHQQNPIL